MTGEVVEILDQDELLSILEFAKKARDFQLQMPGVGKVLKPKNDRLPNEVILQLMDTSKKPELNALLKLHDPEYKIITIVEPVFQQGRLVRRDDSFLFTIRRRNALNIVWESVEADKATHIFKVHPNSYQAFLTNIESYIMSNTDYKRANLHNISNELKDELSFFGSLNHNSQKGWRRNLENALKTKFKIRKKQRID